MSEEKEIFRREEKLKGYENWSRWSNITRLMLKKKSLWALVEGQRTFTRPALQVVTYEKDAAFAARIIKGGVNDELF